MRHFLYEHIYLPLVDRRDKTTDEMDLHLPDISIYSILINFVLFVKLIITLQ